MKEKWTALLQDKKSGKIILAVAAVLLAVIVLLPSGEAEEKVPETTVQTAADRDYEQEMERRLEAILQNIEGAGSVEVMVTLKYSEELILQEDHDSSSEVIEETDQGGGTRKTIRQSDSGNTVITGDTPFVTKTFEPQPEGIIVLADGGDSPQVAAKIHSALMALFDLPSHKIQVLKRESGN